MVTKEDHKRINEKIGQNLKKIRVQKGLSQMDVAVATDIDQGYVCRIEKGKARITFKLLYVLVKGLEITSSDLVDD